MSFFGIKRNQNFKTGKNRRYKIQNREFLVKLIIVIFLVMINFLVGAYLRPNLLNALWVGDDAETINIANNFREKGTFSTTYLGDYIYAENSTSDLFKKYPTISQNEGGKGPVYYVILGSMFKLFNVKTTDLYFYGSILNNFLTSIFLVLFFFFIDKRFNIQIAFFSSLLVLSCSYVAWHSARVDSMPLFNIFCISALFFLEKKRLHYFLFGILTGLAHLTHPFGIFLGITYATFLLINKEFKGFLLAILGWQIFLLPWFIRNYFLFGDFGIGLYVPFSDKISSLLSFIPHREYFLSNISYIKIQYLANVSQHILFDVLSGMYQSFVDFYNMNFLLIFLIMLVPISYFQTEMLRRKMIYIIIVIAIVFDFYLIASGFTNMYVQIIIFFIIPIFLVILLYKIKKQTLVSNLPRIFYFLPLFIYFNLIGYYYTSILLNYSVPEVRQLMLPIFLIIPLAIYALHNIIFKIISQQNIAKSKIISITMALILFPLIFQMASGMESINHFPFHMESSEMQSINAWIRNNATQDQRIGSNFPLETTYRTGLESMALPDFSNQINFEKILDHYDVSYIVLYDNIDASGVKKIHDDIIHSPLRSIQYVDVYSTGSSSIIKVINLHNVNIKNKLISKILENATKSEQQANLQGAINEYEKLLYLSPDEGYKGLIRTFVSFKKYDEAINQYDNYINSYQERMANASSQNEELALQKSMIDAMYSEIKLLTNIGDYDKANDVCLDIIRVNNFDKNAHLQHAEILEKLGMHEDALREYEFAKRLENISK